ncbi:MAG: biopolymer transporter ExbD [Roseibacillus sp.]|jgi:biopolymer transport protein ExbD
MPRTRRAESPKEDQPELSISPLIDICFLLLIYFLVTTTIKQKERDTSMRLPTIRRLSEQPDIQPFFIKVDDQGHIYANVGASQELLDREPAGDDRKLPLLDQRLDTYAAAARLGDDRPLVQIHVEGEALHQRVVDVLNLLAKYEINSVTFTDLLDEE